MTSKIHEGKNLDGMKEINRIKMTYILNSWLEEKEIQHEIKIHGRKNIRGKEMSR